MKNINFSIENPFSLFFKFGYLILGFCLILGIGFSCKKETPSNSATESALSIEAAKNFILSKVRTSEASVSYRDSIGTFDSLGRKKLVLDWSQAVAYYDEIKKQSVVELPVLNGPFSKLLNNPDGIPVDTSLFLQMRANNRLIIVQDSVGRIGYTFMKVSGTWKYCKNYGNLHTNTYRSVNSKFEGVISYVDIMDNVHSIFAKDSIKWYIPGFRTIVTPNTVSSRWAIICINYYIQVPCNFAYSYGDEECYELDYSECYEFFGFAGVNSTPLVVPLVNSTTGSTGGGDAQNTNVAVPPYNPFVPPFPIYTNTGTNNTNNNPQYDPTANHLLLNGGNISYADQACNLNDLANFNVKYQTNVEEYFGDEIVPCTNGCSGSPATFESCALEEIFEFLPTILRDFVKSNKALATKLMAFLVKNGNSPANQDFVSYCTKLIQVKPTNKWERMEELYNLVKANPNALVNCNTPCTTPGSDTNDWQQLASFTPPVSVMNAIALLPTGYDVQEITNASGKRVNLDYFSVRVTKLPTVSGAQLTANELLEKTRKEINSFLDGAVFTPIPADVDLWNSNAPVPAVLNIDMLDDGAVITSQYTASCCWIFTTLDAPGVIYGVGGVGTHPVSGNRQVGFKTLQVQPGGYEFYIKGADRVTKFYHSWGESAAFSGADELWNSWAEKLRNYCIENGGEAQIIAPLILRPDWEDVKIKLTSSTPITQIKCDCN